MNMDIALSSEGDLIMGQQQTDEEGYLLYYTQSANGEPPRITTNPEVGVTAVRDIKLVYEEESQLQLIKSRLNTENPDWYFYEEVGADLTDLIGLPNNQKTAEKGIELIIRALTYDRAFEEKDLEVEAIPVSKDQILYDIQIKRNNNIIRYAITYDLNLGVNNTYEKIN